MVRFFIAEPLGAADSLTTSSCCRPAFSERTTALRSAPAVAEAIQGREADYVLLVKANQPSSLESIEFFFEESIRQWFRGVAHDCYEMVARTTGALSRRCWAFNQFGCLAQPQQWRSLKSFAVIKAARLIRLTESRQRRCDLGNIPAQARQYPHTIRSHRSIENRLHWS